jgi:hypothetical protein
LDLVERSQREFMVLPTALVAVDSLLNQEGLKHVRNLADEVQDRAIAREHLVGPSWETLVEIVLGPKDPDTQRISLPTAQCPSMLARLILKAE